MIEVADINKKSIVTGALILTAAGVITRILGFVYRIYMSNVMGAEGMGLYQLIMPVYSLAWSISCSGFNTAVSKLTAQERAKGEYGNMGRVLKQSVLITASLGCLMSLAVYFCALPLSVYFFKDLRTLLPLRILSLAFPFMAAGTCFRGYFIGLQETFVPAINQVLEQFVRMVVVYLLAARFVPRGLNYACAAAVIGLVCEEVFSLLYVLFAYRRFKAKHKLTKRPVFTRRKSLALLLGMALPLTANRVTGSLLSAWENVLIPARLQVFGLSPAEAVSEFGRITGMASPLIFFPTAVLTALSVTLVPAVAEAAATGNAGRRAGTASKAVLFAAIAGFGAASLFVFFPNELGQVIYKQSIGWMLTFMGVMCPLMYIQIVLAGILNGLGMQVFIFRNSLISSGINIAFIYFLIPRFGLAAFIAGWLVSLIIVVALELHKVRENLTLNIAFANWFAKPALAALMSGVAARVLYDQLLREIAGNTVGLMISVCALLGMFMLSVMLTGCLVKEDVRRLIKIRVK